MMCFTQGTPECKEFSGKTAPIPVKTQIPINCTSWYDGCNTCGAADGQITFCTKMMCFQQETPYCKAYAKPPKDCTSWFDGCNMCGAKDGEVTWCTRMACSEEFTQKAECRSTE